MEIIATIHPDPEKTCGPYTLVWEFTSNSSNTTAIAAVQYLIRSSQNSNLTIPVETLGFGIAYNFKAIITKIIGGPRSIDSISFTTVGGSYCGEGYTFPNFAITSNFYLVFHRILMK